MVSFDSSRVVHSCDFDVYSLWNLFQVLDESFGMNHPLRRDPVLSSSWSSLLSALEQSCFPDGCSYDPEESSLTVFLSPD